MICPSCRTYPHDKGEVSLQCIFRVINFHIVYWIFRKIYYINLGGDGNNVPLSQTVGPFYKWSFMSPTG
jgi:hypothetical protein